MKYIYQNSDWPNFNWQDEKILPLLSTVKIAQNSLLEKMKSSGFESTNKVLVAILTAQMLKAGNARGKNSDPEQMRSLVSKRLCVDLGGKSSKERNVDGVINMTIDAIHNFDKMMSKERLSCWHEALFPTGFSGIDKIRVGEYRKDERGSMKIMSGSIADKKTHYEAPAAEVLENEMNELIDYINKADETDYLIKAGIVHLWFVALHPFDDGNGRIARALTDMMLTKSDKLHYRFYTMSSQIGKDMPNYHLLLEQTLKGTMDVTKWLIWFLEKLLIEIESGEQRYRMRSNKLMAKT